MGLGTVPFPLACREYLKPEGKRNAMYKRTKKRMTADLPLEKMQARRQWNHSTKR